MKAKVLACVVFVGTVVSICMRSATGMLGKLFSAIYEWVNHLNF